MTISPANVAQLKSLVESSPALVPLVKSTWQYNENTLVLVFDINDKAASLDLVLSPSSSVVTGSVLGRDQKMQRHLRNTLVGKARLAIDSSERHILGVWSVNDPSRLLEELGAWIHWLQREGSRSPSEYEPSLPLPLGHASVYWWDKSSNFGDAVGPWLIERMTGLTPSNARNTKLGDRPLLTVGSIIGMLPRDAADIWGSGLMAPLEGPNLEKLSQYTDIKVHAVRGRITRDELITKLGWNVPEIYGDPALLLPRFLLPEGNQASQDKISLVPHYAHAKYFNAVSDKNIHVVDVKQGLEAVVSEIASSRVCVSTSLHGVIIAQAYNVPWVWLRIHDHKLGGDQFKFNDFFSTLDTDTVARADSSGAEIRTLDFNELARRAALPQLNISLDALVAAMPLPHSECRSDPWAPPALPYSTTGHLTKLASAMTKRMRKVKAFVLEVRRRVSTVGRPLGNLRAKEQASRGAHCSHDPALSSMAREIRKQNKVLREIHEAVNTSEGKRRLGNTDDG